MKRRITGRKGLVITLLCAGVFLLAGCGGSDDFENYMKGQPAMRASIDAQLAILSPDARGAVLYKGDTAEVTVTYYALTREEIEGIETEKSQGRAQVIMEDALAQYHQDTGKKADLKVIVLGHDPQE